jgi:alkylated DNA nucleotide flippase Atl1
MPKVIQVLFSDDEYAKFLEEKVRQKAEGSTDAQFIKDIIIPNNDFKRWFPELLRRVDLIEFGTLFNIRAIMATDWVNIPKGVRLALGREFFRSLDSEKVKDISVGEKDSAKTQWYIKEKIMKPKITQENATMIDSIVAKIKHGELLEFGDIANDVFGNRAAGGVVGEYIFQNRNKLCNWPRVVNSGGHPVADEEALKQLKDEGHQIRNGSIVDYKKRKE